MTVPRPRPRLTDETRPFWTGGKDGRLLIMQCSDCGQHSHPPQPMCRHCLSENIAPQPVSGLAKVESFTVNYQPWAKDMEVPFVIARVRLDDAPGVILTTNIVGCPIDAVHYDDPVRVTFEEQDGIYFPLFEKVA